MLRPGLIYEHKHRSLFSNYNHIRMYCICKFGFYKLNNYICNSITKSNYSRICIMDLVSRLKQYLDARQISVTQFADECAIPRPTGSQLLAGRNKKVSDEIISKIHSAYPDLNIVWLMFGEGNMVNDANIEISEPQNNVETERFHEEPAESQPIDFAIDFNENPPEETSEKIQTAPSTNTFTFASPAEPKMTTAEPETRNDEPAAKPTAVSDDSLTVTPGKGKRVTGIVVYYDDCTYESFVPDPNHGHPFMR